MNIISRIKQGLTTFSPSYSRVAHVILDDPKKIKHMSIACLAGLARTSEPTVLRFCRLLGFGGFRDFKVRLTEEEAAKATYGHPDAIDGSQGYIRQMGAINMLIFSKVVGMLEKQDIDKAVDILAKATKVEFWGRCASAAVAQDAYDKFFQAGIPCYVNVTTNDPLLKMSAGMSKPGEVIVAISQTGKNTEMTEAIIIAKSKGAYVIGMTIKDSPVSNECSMTIDLDVQEKKSILSAMVQRYAHLFALDTLAVGVLIKKGALKENSLVTELSNADTNEEMNES